MASSGAGASFCVSKARNSWTPPARLCPELCRKLQLEAAAAGKHSNGGLRMRLHALSCTLSLQQRQR